MTTISIQEVKDHIHEYRLKCQEASEKSKRLKNLLDSLFEPILPNYKPEFDEDIFNEIIVTISSNLGLPIEDTIRKFESFVQTSAQHSLFLSRHPEILDWEFSPRRYWPGVWSMKTYLQKRDKNYWDQIRECSTGLKPLFLPFIFNYKGDFSFIDSFEKCLEEMSSFQTGLMFNLEADSDAEFLVYRHPSPKRPIEKKLLENLPHGPFIGFMQFTRIQIDGEDYLSVEGIQTDILKHKYRRQLTSSARNFYTKGKNHWVDLVLNELEYASKKNGLKGIVIPDITNIAKKFFECPNFYLDESIPVEQKMNDYWYRVYSWIPKKKGYSLQKETNLVYPTRCYPIFVRQIERGNFWVKTF